MNAPPPCRGCPLVLPPLPRPRPQVTREPTDDFVGRQQGYLLLYAAVMQVGGAGWRGAAWWLPRCAAAAALPLPGARRAAAPGPSSPAGSPPNPCRHLPAPPPIPPTHRRPQSDNPANPHGLACAWAYLARLLNALPASRVTATAVDALLKVGWEWLSGRAAGRLGDPPSPARPPPAPAAAPIRCEPTHASPANPPAPPHLTHALHPPDRWPATACTWPTAGSLPSCWPTSTPTSCPH